MTVARSQVTTLPHATTDLGCLDLAEVFWLSMGGVASLDVTEMPWLVTSEAAFLRLITPRQNGCPSSTGGCGRLHANSRLSWSGPGCLRIGKANRREAFEEARVGTTSDHFRRRSRDHREFLVTWFRRYAFASHTGEWLAVVMVVLLSFGLCIASSRLALWRLTRKRNANESDREYWSIHGG
jgi:hypothetical protein